MLLVASSVCPAFALAAGAPVDRATPQQIQRAQAEFETGDEQFDVQRYAEAIAHYRTSYDIVASPNSRLMVARSLQELGRLVEAYREYEHALAEAEEVTKRKPAYADTARAARDELNALRSRVGFLRIDLGDLPPGSEISVGGRLVTLEPGQPLVWLPGKVRVEGKAPDGRVASAEVQLAAGRERSVVLKLGEARALEGAPREAASAPPDA